MIHPCCCCYVNNNMAFILLLLLHDHASMSHSPYWFQIHMVHTSSSYLTLYTMAHLLVEIKNPLLLNGMLHFATRASHVSCYKSKPGADVYPRVNMDTTFRPLVFYYYYYYRCLPKIDMIHLFFYLIDNALRR